MSADHPRTHRFVALVALAAVVAATVSVGRAQDTPVDALQKAAESAPAMQGHDAESRMRDAEAEVRWRRLFFDPAGREEGEAQVSCDHRAQRRPDLVGGPAAVAVAWDPKSGRVVARRWELGEGATIDPEPLRRRLALAAPAGTVIDVHTFRRCR